LKLINESKGKILFGRVPMSISRRRFLSWVGVAGLSLATGYKHKAEAATVEHFEGYPDSFAVLHDSVLCLGCRRCEKACNEINKLPKPKKPFTDLAVLEQSRRTSVKAYTVVNQYVPSNKGSSKPVYYYKKQCNHCLEPACASACFVSAFKKTKDGPVIYDPSVCVGCRYCMVACPFEIPTYEYDSALSPRVLKCNMCYPRVNNGQQPGCVEFCPSGALIFGKRSDLINVSRERIKKNRAKYVDHIYGEHEMGGTSWLYLSGTPFENIGLRTDLGTSAAGEFTAPALSAVPIIAGLWPIFLTGMYAITRSKAATATSEKNAAVENAVNMIQSEAKTELAKAMERAEIDKLATIKQEVKKALENSKSQIEPSKADKSSSENNNTG
jgi:Fe-S-cluster-containing dehydrogenase component